MTTNPRRVRRWLAFAGAVALCATLAVALSAQPSYGTSSVSANPAIPAAAATGGPDFADMIAAVRPAVVTITVEKSMGAQQHLVFPQGGQPPGLNEFFQHFFGRDFNLPNQHVHGLGSGFIIDSKGYIVTNNHVVDDSDHITVTLDNGKKYDADVVGTDPKTDLALIKIDAAGLPALQFGDSDHARAGDWVLAIGNPFGLGGTATVGIISARGRDIQSGPYDDFLQIDAPINQGNSGGPVFNTQGQVIGVNTAIYTPNGGSVGIGFAIPSREVEHVVSELRENGAVDRGWLGVELQNMNENLAQSFGLHTTTGALVADVVPESPAASAGIKAGDVIVGFNGKDVTSAKDLSQFVGSSNSKERVALKLWRNDTLKTLKVTLGRMNEPVRVASSTASGEGAIGLALAPLDHDARARLGLDNDVHGAVVANVDPNSEAAMLGMQSGDVVLSVDRHPVDSPRDVKNAIDQAKRSGKKAVALLVRRGEDQEFLVLGIG